MKIRFDLIQEANRDLISNLIQFECYDLCTIYNKDLEENGRFSYELHDCYIRDKESYIIRIDDKIAGFLLVRKKIGLVSVEEFWIYPKYRKGLTTYKVLREYCNIKKGLVEYLILKERESWVKTLEYMFRKHPNYVEIVIKQDIQLFINSEVRDFVRYVVRVKERNN